MNTIFHKLLIEDFTEMPPNVTLKIVHNDHPSDSNKVAVEDTECVSDLDKQSEMIIFESFLTTLKQKLFFEADGTVAKVGLSLKPNHHNQV